MRIAAERENQNTCVRFQMNIVEIESLKQKIFKLKEIVDERKYECFDDIEFDLSNSENKKLNGSFVFVSKMKVCENQTCRVAAYNPELSLQLIAKKSPHPEISPGYGILKINSVEFYGSRTRTEFVRIHQDLIRDIQCSFFNSEYLLSASYDKSFKLTNLKNNCSMLT